MANTVAPVKFNQLIVHMRDGDSARVAASRVGMHPNTAYSYLKKLRAQGIDPIGEQRVKKIAVDWKRLTPEGKRGIDDFDFFRLHFMGHLAQPWATEAAATIREAIESAHREYLIMNVSPGVGKTTLLHDFAAWVTVRDRSIRGVFGSKNATNARRMMRRLRRTLERTRPVKAKPEDIEHGLALDAKACLAYEYGVFRPAVASFAEKDVWNNDEFVVIQADGTPIDEKESTWTAFGIKSDILSMRYDLMLCDDMDDATTTTTQEQIATQRSKYDDEIETRLEPRGVIALVMQRIDPQDLSRYNLDKRVPLDPDEFDDMDETQLAAITEQAPSMYRHIVYKAHDDNLCQGKPTHRADSPAWPNGCLLDPPRLPWRDIRNLRSGKPRTFAVQYQQEDVDPTETLVHPSWITGGTAVDEATGMEFEAPGCVDKDRGLCELPKELAGPLYSIATVDPSPSKMWAVQWWISAPNAANQVFLMDTVQTAMGGNELLDWDPNKCEYEGIMDRWQKRSVDLGYPIQHWIVEDNSANKFLLPYKFHQLWRAKYEVNLTPHTTTGVNKLDPQTGVTIIKSWFKHGRIRLPYRAGEAFIASRRLIDEAVRYRPGEQKQSGTDDQVMGCWFLFANLPNLAVAPSIDEYQPRPGFVRQLDARRFLQAVS